jgi:thiamine-monophosphate kinase
VPQEHDIAGEDSLIRGYFAPLAAGFAGAFGLEDDCAALSPEPGRDIVLKTDAVAEGVHFFATDAPEDIAWKAVAVNVSDLAAKGATPIGYLMSLSFPVPPARAWLERFVAGLREAQERFGMSLIGGDTDRRPNAPVSITVMAIGSVPKGRMVRRGTAQAGDVLYVTGTLGDAALGLRLRTGEIDDKGGAHLAASEREFLLRRYLRPEPRLALVSVLLAFARSAMDLSDGLVKDLGRLCRASGKAAQVEAWLVPLSPPARTLLERRPELALLPLTGGDDYEILVTVAPEAVSSFEAAARGAGVPVTRIGAVCEGGGVTVRDSSGRTIDIASPGYDHF